MTKEQIKDDLKKKTKVIIKRLADNYSDAKCHLDFRNEFELLVSTVLAAQCTDVRVNMTMTPLYKTKYKTPKDILEDGIDNFRDNIKSINFYNNKAKAILSLCEVIEKEHKGKVPSTMEDLTALPGVGRKSASVILGNCYGKQDVIIVDTHLKRVSTKLGLIENENPEKIEIELKEIVPEKEQFHFSMRIGEHGRMICQAKKPKCEECFLNDICPSFKI
jgi:endonuclease III